jgi:hypothetical protein
VVTVPEGKYVLASPVTIKSGVHLYGLFQTAPDFTERGGATVESLRGSVLRVTHAAGPAFTMTGVSPGLAGFTIYYPHQTQPKFLWKRCKDRDLSTCAAAEMWQPAKGTEVVPSDNSNRVFVAETDRNIVGTSPPNWGAQVWSPTLGKFVVEDGNTRWSRAPDEERNPVP